MNEKIKQLAEQAGFSSGVIINIGTSKAEEIWIRYNEDDDKEEFPTSDMMTKFAELIVRECSRVAKLKIGHNKVCDAIEQHFGVE